MVTIMHVLHARFVPLDMPSGPFNLWNS